MLAEIGKIDPKKDYTLEFAPNDMMDESQDRSKMRFLPKLTVRGDIVYKLHRYGFTNDYILNSIANCLPNHCFAAYFLLE
jgi:hypothetical protein